MRLPDKETLCCLLDPSTKEMGGETEFDSRKMQSTALVKGRWCTAVGLYRSGVNDTSSDSIQVQSASLQQIRTKWPAVLFTD
jgi:hypothetical protein